MRRAGPPQPCKAVRAQSQPQLIRRAAGREVLARPVLEHGVRGKGPRLRLRLRPRLRLRLAAAAALRIRLRELAASPCGKGRPGVDSRPWLVRSSRRPREGQRLPRRLHTGLGEAADDRRVDPLEARTGHVRDGSCDDSPTPGASDSSRPGVRRHRDPAGHVPVDDGDASVDVDASGDVGEDVAAAARLHSDVAVHQCSEPEDCSGRDHEVSANGGAQGAFSLHQDGRRRVARGVGSQCCAPVPTSSAGARPPAVGGVASEKAYRVPLVEPMIRVPSAVSAG